MYKQDFIEIVRKLKIARITSFSVSYKEYDIDDDPINTIKLEDNNEKSNTL